MSRIFQDIQTQEPSQNNWNQVEKSQVLKDPHLAKMKE